MKKFLFIPAFALSIIFCYSQEKPDTLPRVYPYNSIYLELGGNSIYFGSLNYERILLHRKFYYLSVRGGIGGGYIPIPPPESMISFPLLINSIFQLNRGSAIELGTGVSWMLVGTEEGESSNLGIWETGGDAPVPTGTIGYRYQAKKGFLLRVNFTPFTNFKEIFYFFGISFGYSFPRTNHQ
jgi:hypothetical protein